MAEDHNSNSNANQSANSNRALNAILVDLMERTGYNMVQENGQRKFGGPPPKWEGPPPPKGCEVFVGKIPRDCFENELVPVFQNIGPIYELRLMMDFSGTNRGYAFVMYTNSDDARKAIAQLNNYQLRPGRYIGVVKSVDNCRLFVGGIPKSKTKEEILDEMSKVTDGVVSIILYNSPKDKTKNRGFAFIEYESHRAAAVARRKLMPGRIPLWGQAVLVDWAEPEPEVDEETMSKVKVLYVRNLMESTSEDAIREKFDQVHPGSVEKVKKLRDFCFVHFTTREDAESALEKLNGINLDGSVLEVSWAKPPDKAAASRNYLRPAINGPMTAYAYNTTAAYVDSHQFTPPYGVSAPSVIAFPNAAVGRGCYGPRSPGRGRGRGAAGLRGGRVYFGGGATRSTEVLAEYCQKHNLGEPQYHLHSTIQTGTNGNEQLFIYKVAIPTLGGQYYTPRHLSRNLDEAKQVAANYALNVIYGMNWDELSPPNSTSPLPISPTATLSTCSNGDSPLLGPYSPVCLSRDVTQPFKNGPRSVLPGITGHTQSCEALPTYYEIPANYQVTAPAHY